MVDEKTEVLLEGEEEDHAAASDDVLEPSAGKGIPSYRPWDWIAGYAFAALIALTMFGLAESMYDLAK